MKPIGIVLIVLGVICLALGGFTYTTKEKILDIGPIEASREKPHSIPLPPIAGAAVLVCGIAVLVINKR